MKYILYSVLGLLGLFIGLLIILPFVVDPNDYKQEITELAQKHTGRSMEIDGDLELTVFPWVGIRTGRIVLGNAEGFDDKPFVAVDKTQVRIKLIPLLSKNIEIGQIIVTGFEANLMRDSEGRTNWDDLVAASAPATVDAQPEPMEAPDSESAGINSLQVDGLQIEGGSFSFIDEQAGSKFEISNLQAETGSISPNSPIDFSLSLQVAALQPQINGNVELQTTLDINTEQQLYTLRTGDFTFSGTLPEFLDGVLDARLGWQEVAFDNAQQQLDVGELDFSALGLTAKTSFVATHLDGDPTIKGKIGTEPFALQDLANNLGSMMPEGMSFPPAAQANFDTDFDVDLDNQTLQIDALTLGLADLQLSASISGEKIIDAPRFSGKLDAENFSPTRLLVNLGQEAISTTDPNVLASASLATQFAATDSSVEFTNMNLALDQSVLKGRFGIADFEKQSLRFDLVIDDIDADRYLPPAEYTEETTDEDTGDLNAMVLPLEPINTLDIQGRFQINKLHAFSMNTSNVDFTIGAANGVVRIHPAKADMYDGQYSGNILYRVDQKQPLVSINETISDIEIGGMSQDLFDENRISGLTNMTIRLSGRGKTVGDVRSTLTGRLSFELRDGAVAGADLMSAIKNAMAISKGEKSEGDVSTQGKTEFAELKGAGPVRKGIWTTKNLGAEVLNVVVNGKGTVNLATEALDLELKTTIRARQDAEGLDIPELENVPFVIPVKGTLSEPDMGFPKLDEVLKAKLKQKTQEKTKKIKEEGKKSLKDKLKGLIGG